MKATDDKHSAFLHLLQYITRLICQLLSGQTKLVSFTPVRHNFGFCFNLQTKVEESQAGVVIHRVEMSTFFDCHYIVI
jgi:hypothetical protein